MATLRQESEANLLRKGSVMLVRDRRVSSGGNKPLSRLYKPADELESDDGDSSNAIGRSGSPILSANADLDGTGTTVQAKHLAKVETVTVQDLERRGQMAPFTLIFQDPDFETAFHHYFFEKSIKICRRACYISLGAFLLFQLFQVIAGTAPNTIGQWASRIGAVVFVLLLIIFMTTDLFRHHMQLSLSLTLLIVGLGLVGSAYFSQVTNNDGSLKTEVPILALIIFFTFTYNLVRLRFIFAVVVTWITALSFAAASIIVHGSETVILVNLVYIICALLINMYAAYSSERYLRNDYVLNQVIELESDKSNMLLKEMLPEHVAQQLKDGALGNSNDLVAESYDECTILFCSVAGFAQLSDDMTPADLVQLLNSVFSIFDEVLDSHEVFKVETIANTYMVAAGVPERRSDHVRLICNAALDMLRAMRGVTLDNGAPLNFKLGIHTGPVVAGVLGLKMPRYHLWGDTVNTASRMSSTTQINRIQMSSSSHRYVANEYRFDSRGKIPVKGKGMMECFFLEGPIDDHRRRRSQPLEAEEGSSTARSTKRRTSAQNLPGT